LKTKKIERILYFEKKPRKELFEIHPEEQEDQADILNVLSLFKNFSTGKLLTFMAEEMIYYSLIMKTKEFNI